MAADTCRLCLRPIDQAKSSDLLTETTKLAMLKEFLPEMNLDITENTEVCNNCMEELETSFNFKNGVVVNEANIQAKLEGKKQKKIDLKLMLDDVAKKELKKSDYICRTCLSICKSPSISLFDSPSNMMPYSFVKKMCEVVFELELIASAKPVLCDDCWETLQTVYNFRKSCLRTDERLRIYVGTKNVTKLSIGDFKKFAEENPVKDEDEDFSDEELDGYVKDEPIDEEELKIDPEEASCSSSSVKVKQETEVKSESELNSDDEVKEDEPELLDPKAVKSEADGLDGGDCKMEIGDVKVDAEGGDVAGTSGQYRARFGEQRERVQRFSCSRPSYTVPRKDTLRQHLKTLKGTIVFCCPHCPEEFIMKSHLKRHIFMAHKDESGILEFSCLHCSFKTLYKESFQRHLETHKSNSERAMFTCAECSAQYTRKYRLVHHIHGAHKRPEKIKLYECLHCPFKISCNAAFQLHLETHGPYPERKIFTCAECSKEFTKKPYLVSHIFRIHQRPEEKKIFQCSHCSFKVPYKSKIQFHMETHKSNSERQMFTCAECSKQYTRKYILVEHILRAHRGPDEIKMFPCLHCPFKTLHKTALQYHLQTHKPNSERQMFTCAECSKGYTKKHSLVNHILREHQPPEETIRFQCSQCSFKTKYSWHIQPHLETHKPNSERQMFICAHCSKELLRKSSLVSHIITVHKRQA